MGADAAVDVLSPIAISAQNLETGRILVLAQPLVERAHAADGLAMCCAVIVDVIDGEKHWLHLTTASTFEATISHKCRFAVSGSIFSDFSRTILRVPGFPPLSGGSPGSRIFFPPFRVRCQHFGGVTSVRHARCFSSFFGIFLCPLP